MAGAGGLGGEVLVAAGAGGEAPTAAWDCGAGAPCGNFAECACAPGGLARAGPRGPLLACQAGRPCVATWEWGRPGAVHRSFVAEKLARVAVLGAFVVGGGQSGRAYVWEAASGRLLRLWDAHFRAVSALQGLAGGTFLLSGGRDGLVHLWNLAELLDKGAPGSTNVKPQPACTWSEHRLPVTGLCAARGGSCDALAASCSLDRSMKLFVPGAGRLLCSVQTPAALNCVGLDPLEQSLYAGGADGRIFAKLVTAASGQVTREHPLGPDLSAVLVGHSGPVTCLGFGEAGLHLFSGSEDGTVRMWDLENLQTIRSFSLSGHPVQDLVLLRPTAPSLEEEEEGKPAAGGGSAAKRPLCAVQPLQKYLPSDGGLEGWAGPQAVDGGAQAAPGLWEVPVEEMVPGFHYRHCFKNLGIPELLAEGGAAQLKE